jgi:sulfoxide reductase catalytic subunit YedY
VPPTAAPAPANAQATGAANVSGPEAPKKDELGDAATPYTDIAAYNNFYEFSLDKQVVAQASRNFTVDPWQVQIGGLVGKPMTVDLADILKQFAQEERIYRMRCVEAWSMVIPWSGFSLSKLLKLAEPKAEAKFVRFETAMKPAEMPGLRDKTYPWPYTEGLRIDEAMHDLTTLATGIYGRPLLPQNGAPIRLVVPWKYGFKSIKSIVKIDLVAEQPKTLWNSLAANEYGFFSNVNPDVRHPRWSQASERRIGENARRRTLMFNGYEQQVGALYAGMDLARNY